MRRLISLLPASWADSSAGRFFREREAGAYGHAACLFRQKQALPEFRCTLPNPRSVFALQKPEGSNPTQVKTRAKCSRFNLAEREGFEPSVSCPTLVFKTSTLNRSATSP